MRAARTKSRAFFFNQALPCGAESVRFRLGRGDERLSQLRRFVSMNVSCSWTAFGYNTRRECRGTSSISDPDCLSNLIESSSMACERQADPNGHH